VDIDAARILTERGAAIDTFYVRERNAGKILSEDRQALIRNQLLEAISRFDPAP
jgi:UTP:GlnB (protein PII) uridylyltransferase